MKTSRPYLALAMPFLVPIAFLFGCTKAEIAAVDTSVIQSLPVVMCVTEQIEGGITDPVAIGIACGGLAVKTVIQIASTVDTLSATADAGTLQYASPNVHAFVLANTHK